jgi:peptidoglycan biosynthesis protein MviN/MurJ (putative lipid II flippase)
LARTASSALSVSSGLGFLVAWGTVLCAPDLLAVLGGKNQWPSAVALTRILTFAALPKLLQSVLGSTFHAVGNARSMTVSAGIQLLALAPALFFGQRLGGIQGIALGVSLASWLRLAVTCVWLARDFELPLQAQLKSAFPGMSLAAISAVVALPLQYVPVWPWLRLVLSAVVMLTWFVLSWELYRARFDSSHMPSLARPALRMASSAWLRLRRAA